MRYKFSEQNRIKFPESYMYTKYYGKNFVSAYRKSRKKFLGYVSKISRRELLSRAHKLINNGAVFNGIEGDGKDLLVLASEVFAKDADCVYEKLSVFVKKYEVTKRLYSFQIEDGRPNDRGYERIEPYILLGLACAGYYLRYGNLKFMNCLLKVGDLVVSRTGKIKGPELKTAADIMINLELTAFQALIKAAGVEI